MPNDRPTPSMEGKKSGNSITPGESGTVAASGGADRSPRRSRSGARPRLRRARAAVRSETGECPGPGRPAEGEYRETPESAGERQGPSGPDRRATGCRLAIRNLRQSNSIRGTAYPDPGAGRQPPRSVTERIRPRAGSPGRSPVRLAPETGAAGKRNRKTGIPRRTGSASRSRPGTRRTGASRFEESRQSAENSIRRVRSLRIARRRAPTSVRTTADHDPGARRRRRSRGTRTRPAGSRAAPSSSGAGPQPPGRGIEGPVSPGERARLPAPGRRRGGPAPQDSRSPGSPRRTRFEEFARYGSRVGGRRPRFEPPRITTRALAVVVGLEGRERGRPAPARPRLRPAPGRSRREGESKAPYPPENGLGFPLPAGGAADRRLPIRGVPAVRAAEGRPRRASTRASRRKP